MRPETEAALQAVGVALELAADRVGAEEIASKGGRDLVTATDVAAEDAIRAELLGRYPDCPVVGEERGGESEVVEGRPYWLVDPICGTRNYASDLPLYCVNVALVEDGRVALAAVGDGGTGDRYVAERGRGARLLTASGDRPLRASDASATLAVEPGASRDGPHHAHAGRFTGAALAENRRHVRMLGTSFALAHLAAGRLAGYVNFASSSPVHIAAGCLLAAEAGAIVTDLDGRPWDLTARTVLAAAGPELHRDLFQMLSEASR